MKTMSALRKGSASSGVETVSEVVKPAIVYVPPPECCVDEA